MKLSKLNLSDLMATILLLGIIMLVIFASGCAGTVKTKNADGSSSEVPAAVAIQQAATGGHEACPKPQPYVPVPIGAPCPANDVPCNNKQALIGVSNAFAKMEYQEEQKEALKYGCHAQVASEVKSFNQAQETKYRETGGFGKTLTQWVSGIFIVKEVAKNDQQTPNGDTNIEELNMNANANGGELTPSGGVNQSLNINSNQNLLGPNAIQSGGRTQAPGGDNNDADGNNSTLNSDGII